MDSLHKGGGFKTIYMRKGAIEKKLEKNVPAPSKREGARKVENSKYNRVIYIIITGVRLSICLYVRLCVPQLLPHFLTDYKNKGIYGFLAQRGRF